MDDNMLLNLALDAGEIMLAAGAETHRVEDTMERILSMGGENLPEAITFSNVLIVSQEKHLLVALTLLKYVVLMIYQDVLQQEKFPLRRLINNYIPYIMNRFSLVF